MKKFLLPLFLLIGLNAFSTNYYVDSTATGTHDGETWATAYDSLQSALKIAGKVIRYLLPKAPTCPPTPPTAPGFSAFPPVYG